MGMKPLVSFCLKSYNQKELFREALKAAFAQTYSPLEILILDDCSTDGSQTMISSMIDEYKRNDGTHIVRFESNSENLGLMRNMEKLVSMSHGELCIQADGDDISLPDRTARIVDAWLKHGKKATVIQHGWLKCDLKGRIIGSHDGSGVLYPQGCAMAYVPDVVRKFPPVKVFSASDDIVFNFRGFMLGDRIDIPDHLVLYRYGTGVSSSLILQRQPRVRADKLALNSCRQTWIDISSCEGQCGYVNQECVKAWTRDREISYGAELRMVSADSFKDRLTGFWQYTRMKNVGPLRPAFWIRYLAFALPHVIGDPIADAWGMGKYLLMRVRSRIMRKRYDEEIATHGMAKREC